MSSILIKFNEFVESHKGDHSRDYINLSSLSEDFNNTTPIELKMSSSASASEMATIILINLNSYAPDSTFPLFGLQAINKIVRKDAHVEDAMVQQIMLLHLTKMKWDPYLVAKIMVKLDRLTVDIKRDDRLNEWQLISSLTVQNKHLRKLIDETITDTFGVNHASRVFATKCNEVDVTFIASEITDLRGFSGFNNVYINRAHFDAKADNPKLPSDLILLDVVTVTIHELAHVRVRQVFDDLNANCPILTAELPVKDPEFGRIVERKFFGAAVDWFDSISIGALPLSYITDFLNAIRQNNDLPTVPEDAIIHDRSNLVTFYGCTGIDISYGGMNQ